VVVRVVVIDATHLGGVIVIPAIVLGRLHGMRLGEAARKSLYKLVLEICRAMGQRAGLGDMGSRQLGGGGGLVLAVLAPDQIVEGPGSVGDAPVRHHASRVKLESPLEALDALFFVKGEAPVEPKIKPALSLRR